MRFSIGEGAWLVTDDSNRPGSGSYSVLDVDTYEEGDSGFWGFVIVDEGEQTCTMIWTAGGTVNIPSFFSDNVGVHSITVLADNHIPSNFVVTMPADNGETFTADLLGFGVSPERNLRKWRVLDGSVPDGAVKYETAEGSELTYSSELVDYGTDAETVLNSY